MKKIKISKDLCNYIEMLQYEAFRYKDLMQTIHRNISPMSDEEWEDSFAFYQRKCAEAEVSYEIAKEEICNLYEDVITNDKKWAINYQTQELWIDDKDIIIPQRIEQYHAFLARIYPSSENKSIKINGYYTKSITLQVTEACNMACSYCYQHHKSQNSMSFNTAKQIIDMLLDSDEKTNSYITSTYCNGAIIDFIGGEPLLEIDLISKISDYFIGEMFRRKHPWIIKFKFSICSNGLLYFEPKVQEYLTKHQKHIHYAISIDGNKELHDSCRIDLLGNPTYERAIAAVKDYYNNYSKILSTKMTLSPNNISNLSSALIDMIQNNYTHINLNCMFEEGWNNTHASIMYNELKKITDWLYNNNLIHTVYLSIFGENIGQPIPLEQNNNWCGGTGSMLAFNYKGNAYPCLRYMESSIGNRREPFIIGNINEGINTNPIHQERIKCLECITRTSQSSKDCINCPIASGCGWCSGYNYEIFGTPNKRATFICCMHKARILANYYYQKKKGNLKYSIVFPEDWALEIISKQEYDNLMKG